jgi:hypothetical protein
MVISMEREREREGVRERRSGVRVDGEWHLIIAEKVHIGTNDRCPIARTRQNGRSDDRARG